jgi:hypothetical protein
MAIVDYHRMQPDEARKWLDKARSWVRDSLSPKEGTSAKEQLSWQERVDLDYLLREAESLVNPAQPKIE